MGSYLMQYQQFNDQLIVFKCITCPEENPEYSNILCLISLNTSKRTFDCVDLVLLNEGPIETFETVMSISRGQLHVNFVIEDGKSIKQE